MRRFHLGFWLFSKGSPCIHSVSVTRLAVSYLVPVSTIGWIGTVEQCLCLREPDTAAWRHILVLASSSPQHHPTSPDVIFQYQLHRHLSITPHLLMSYSSTNFITTSASLPIACGRYITTHHHKKGVCSAVFWEIERKTIFTQPLSEYN